jgi:hypothetical protein
MAPTLKRAAKVAGTVFVLLTTPIWMPVVFLVWEVNWRGVWNDLQRVHEELWK